MATGDGRIPQAASDSKWAICSHMISNADLCWLKLSTAGPPWVCDAVQMQHFIQLRTWTTA